MMSIFDGTWGSGPWPEEMVLADLLLETGWTWAEWDATPPYLQRVIFDFIQMRREKQQEDAHEQERRMRQEGTA